MPYCVHLATFCVLPPRPFLQLKDPAPHCQPEPLLWPPNQHQMTNLKPNASVVSTPPAPSSAYHILFKSKINYFSSAALWIKKKWNYKIKRKKKMLWRDRLPPSLPHSSSVFSSKYSLLTSRGSWALGASRTETYLLQTLDPSHRQWGGQKDGQSSCS